MERLLALLAKVQNRQAHQRQKVAELSVYTEAMDSWFFRSFFFPVTWISVAGPEGDEERSGEEVLRLNSDSFNDGEF